MHKVWAEFGGKIVQLAQEHTKRVEAQVFDPPIIVALIILRFYHTHIFGLLLSILDEVQHDA